MKKLLETLSTYQEINVEQKGIQFAEEVFTDLYEEAFSAGMEHIKELRISTGKGALIGAAGVGMVWLSVAGINRFRKKRKLNVNKKGDPIKVPKEFKEQPLELSDVDDVIKNAKKLSKKDREALAHIITEINQNSKVH
jgi:hypothetical protein